MKALYLALTLALIGCGDKRPPAPTDAENQRLDEAGAMLDGAANEERAAPESAAPPKTTDSESGT